jgi:hypothetical protein
MYGSAMALGRRIRRGSAQPAVTFVLVFAVLLLWGSAVPRFAAPDENQHAVRAYAVVHGDNGRLDPATGSRLFRVPTLLSGEPVCFAVRPSQPASCQPVDDGSGLHDTPSSAASYPPFYYLLVGWPTLVSSGATMFQLMRAVSAFWVALLLAIGIQNVAGTRRSGPWLPAFLVVLAPNLLFLGATVTPSGVALAAGVAVWTGGLRLVRDDLRLGPALARVGVPLCLMILIRRDSVLWAGLIVVFLLALARREALTALVRSRLTWLWTAVTLVCVIVQLSLSGAETGASIAGGGGGGSTALNALGDLPYYLHQMVGGILGWLDTQLPAGVYLVYFLLLGFLLLTGLCFAPRRFAIVLALLVGTTLLVPVAIGFGTYPYFQGRYLLPFAFGVPLVAARGISESRLASLWSARVAWVLVPIVGLTQVLAFAQVMRRFTAGAGGDWWFVTTPPWRPGFAPLTVIMLLYTVVLGALLGWLGVLLSPRRSRPAAEAAPIPDDLRAVLST